MIKTAIAGTVLALTSTFPALDGWVDQGWASGALLTVEDSSGTRADAAGEARVGGYFRIGSTTKTFVATVVMQLVDEGRVVRLDDPVDRYVAGVPKGDNGAQVTVRQVLNHTSGLYDYAHEAGYSTNRWRGADRFRTYRPQELLDVAFARKSYFDPGEGWHYSNTNYIVAGMVIERVTGRTYGDEVRSRILRPLGLAHTIVPGQWAGLPHPHARGHTRVDGQLVDATLMNPSLDWAAGEMISTADDLNRFFDALLGGRLTSASSLEAMRQTEEDTGTIFAYGLGLQRYDLPCGRSVWGHGGQLIGYLTYATRADDGRRATLSYNPLPAEVPAEAVVGLFSSVYC
ncbi:serine hydrolase domain-containing protein [Saccharothrix deserti]|uniref:serine hydrolase domain-containing protein n=1 Tax=Saccharothrix deserti TaxID=2593674 RepID=UPI00131AE143|nr:serine hydrolase domain-containing protein [Saccharothrix deserti]